MNKTLFIKKINVFLKVIFALSVVVLMTAVQPLLAQDEPRGEPQEQPEDEDRRVRRLRDSLVTDPNAEWVPGLDASGGQEQLDRKLLLGERALESGELIQPPNANALEFFQEALEIDPRNQQALDGISQVAVALMEQARSAQGSGDRDGALRLIQQVKTFQPEFPGLIDLESDISRRGEVDSLLARASDLLGSGQLNAPDGDNALASYRAVLAIDGGNTRAREGLKQVEAGLISRARGALGNDDFDGAFGLLDAAAIVDGGSQEIERARADVVDRRDELWNEQLAAVRSDIQGNRLEQADQQLASVVNSGYQGAAIQSLRDQIAEGYILRQYQPGNTFSDDNAPLMVVIARGEFSMGSTSREQGRSENEGPRQTIRFPRPFSLSQTEITVAQFRRFVDATNYVSDAEKTGKSTVYNTMAGNLKDGDGVNWRQDFRGQEAEDEYPVVHVSWNDAKAYADWLSVQTGERYRLPSEAEFEYALRAGTTTTYWWGNDRPGEKVENLTGDGDKIASRWEWPDPFRRYSDGHWGPAPSGSFVANPFGLFDIGGNAMEWVGDCYVSTLANVPPDGKAQTTPGCTLHVIRGGSWASPPRLVRSAYRSSAQANRTSCLIGFRLVREL